MNESTEPMTAGQQAMDVCARNVYEANELVVQAAEKLQAAKAAFQETGTDYQHECQRAIAAAIEGFLDRSIREVAATMITLAHPTAIRMIERGGKIAKGEANAD